ncbi:MAG: hypothetical protein AB4352_02890 [Hormoscilla sp.]
MKPTVFLSRSGKIVVGKPDYWNITTLTDKLPNTPILPWNHYDSPSAPESRRYAMGKILK